MDLIIKILFFIGLISIPVIIVGVLVSRWAQVVVIRWLERWEARHQQHDEERDRVLARIESGLEKKGKQIDQILESIFERSNER